MAVAQAEPTEAHPPEQPGADAAPQEGAEQKDSQQERIARQYANLRREKRKWQEERAAWEKERGAGQAELSRLSEMRSKAKGNIGAWLQAGNISPQDLNAFLTRNTEQANDPTHQRISEETRGIREELAAYKAELAELKKSQETNRTIDKIKSVVDSKPDEYELIRAYDAHADVAELMDLWLAEKGERLSEAQACEIIERTIEDQNGQTVERALATRKIAKRIGWQKPGASDDDPESQQGEEDEAPASDEPPAKQRSKPTRGKPKLTNASPSSGQRKPEVSGNVDPYDDSEWQQFKAAKTKRR